MKGTALISGVSGQDGTYLAEHLLAARYRVHGFSRNPTNLQNSFMPADVILHQGDIRDVFFLHEIFSKVKPDLVFNLASQSEVRLSCDTAHATTLINSIGALNMLEVFYKHVPSAKFYQASSSEIFGNMLDVDNMQRETTCMRPITPYGISKLFAHNLCEYYRSQYNLFVCSGILFNHESPRRPEKFLTTKVVKTAVEIKLGKAKRLNIGNLKVARDWGHSKDYTKSMLLMLEQEVPSDFVISSMKSNTVEYLVKYVFDKLDLDFDKYVIQDDKLVRKIDQKRVCGDSLRARQILGWQQEYTFESMLDEMIDFWIKKIGN